MAQINDLEQFSEQIERLLEKYQSDPVIAEKTVKHQRNLEKLLDTTNRLLSDDDTVEVENFDKLLTTTERSYKQMREQNKDNKQFQKTFKKQFGEQTGAGSVGNRVFQQMQMTLSDLNQSVKTLNQQATKEVSDTALSFIGGPLGKMATEMFDFRGAAQAFRGGRQKRAGGQQNEGNIRGIFDAGTPYVPKRGSYYLDEGERVVSRDNNDALTEFAEEAKDRGLKIFSESASKDYFDPLSDKLKNEGVRVRGGDEGFKTSIRSAVSEANERFNEFRTREHREQIDNLRAIQQTIRESNDDTKESLFLSMKMQYQRFMRHPFFNTGLIFFKTVNKAFGWLLKGLRFLLLGRRTSIEEKQLRAIEEQTQLLRTGQIERRGFFDRGGVLGSIARIAGFRRQIGGELKGQTQATRTNQTIGQTSAKQRVLPSMGGMMPSLRGIGHGTSLGMLSAQMRALPAAEQREDSAKREEKSNSLLESIKDYMKKLYGDFEDLTSGEGGGIFRKLLKFGLIGAGIIGAGSLPFITDKILGTNTVGVARQGIGDILQGWRDTFSNIGEGDLFGTLGSLTGTAISAKQLPMNMIGEVADKIAMDYVRPIFTGAFSSVMESLKDFFSNWASDLADSFKNYLRRNFSWLPFIETDEQRRNRNQQQQSGNGDFLRKLVGRVVPLGLENVIPGLRSNNFQSRNRSSGSNIIMASPDALSSGIMQRQTYQFENPDVIEELRRINRQLRKDDLPDVQRRAWEDHRSHLMQQKDQSVTLPANNVDDLMTYMIINQLG